MSISVYSDNRSSKGGVLYPEADRVNRRLEIVFASAIQRIPNAR